MKALFIARNFLPIKGGAEKLNSEIAYHLNQRIKLDVIANRKNRFSPLFFILAPARALSRRDIDLILLSDALLSPFIPFLKLFTRKPVLLKIHGLDITFGNKLYQFFITRFIQQADKIICISEAVKREALKRGINPAKCAVIPPGINPRELSLKGVDKAVLRKDIDNKYHLALGGGKIILSVGHLARRKGFYWFIDAVIPEILKKRNDFIYCVAGKGAFLETILGIIKERKLEKYVRVLKEIDDELLKLLYNAADIFVMPNIPVKSNMEGFGIVILEAASCGLPIVASDLEGIRDSLLGGEMGILAPALDSKEFCRHISGLLVNDALRYSMGKNAQELMSRHFSWEIVIKQYLETFKNTLG